MAAAPTPSMKTLTIGPPKGQISNLISKVSAINSKHGPFHALFVVGDFFSSSDNLNAEEADLLDGKSALPIRTYVFQSSQAPPPRVRNLIKGKQKQTADASEDDGDGDDDDADAKPVKVAENLYWLGKDQVNWVPRDGPNNVGDSTNGQHVDAKVGLRVAVCGGKWDPQRWAQEVQGRVEPVDPSSSESVDSSEAESYILPSNLDRLYRHPAFKPSKPQDVSVPGSSSATQEPQSLAAARAQMKAEQAALSSSPSSTPQQPSIDLLLLPTWPSGITLFANNFPPAGVPPEARTWGLPPFAEVMRRARPRYAFAIAPPPSPESAAGDAEWAETGVFWEREPYSTAAVSTSSGQSSGSGSNAAAAKGHYSSRITRFVSLANFANAKKVRWFLALNLPVGASVTESSATAAALKSATKSPFGEFHSVAAPTNAKRKADGNPSEEGLNSDVNFRWQQKSGKKQRTESGQTRDDGPPPEGYICKICGSREHYIRLCPHKGQDRSSNGGRGGVTTGLPNRPEGAEEALGPRVRREPVQMVGPQDCWFCLSNTGCAKHLVVAIGQEAYLALPKGQLPPASSDASPVPGGGHVLIIPVTHTPSIQSLTSSTSKLNLANEMEEYLSALSKCYAAYGCTLIAWCIVKHSNTRAGHLQIQCVPVPESRILTSGAGPSLSDALVQEATQRGYDLQEVTDSAQQKLGSNAANDEYFEVHILRGGDDGDSGDTRKRQTYRLDLKSVRRFDYQFARTTLANYLGVPDRADWRRCAKSEKVEEVETRSFRECFSEWMPEFGEDDEDDDEE